MSPSIDVIWCLCHPALMLCHPVLMSPGIHVTRCSCHVSVRACGCQYPDGSHLVPPQWLLAHAASQTCCFRDGGSQKFLSEESTKDELQARSGECGNFIW